MPRSPYIAAIRERIGSQQLLIPTVTVLIDDGDGRYLLGRRREVQDWVTIGGMVEPGDSPVSAASREALEETGCEVELGRLLLAYGGPAYALTYPNGDQVCCVGTVYAARLIGEPVPDMDELDQLGWFTPSEFETININPFNRSLLTELGLLGAVPVSVRAARPSDLLPIESCVLARNQPHLEASGRGPAPLRVDYGALVGRGEIEVATMGESLVGFLVGRREGRRLVVDDVVINPACRPDEIRDSLVTSARDRAEAERLELTPPVPKPTAVFRARSASAEAAIGSSPP